MGYWKREYTSRRNGKPLFRSAARGRDEEPLPKGDVEDEEVREPEVPVAPDPGPAER